VKASQLLVVPAVLTLLLSSIGQGQAADDWQKITDRSPDQAYAVRITCSSEPDDPKNIDPGNISAIDLVSMPAKKTVLTLGVPNTGQFKAIWSSDSKWFAYYLSEGPRVGYTHVCRFHTGTFAEIATDNLRVEVKGDVRNEYVQPVRWSKPGTLVFEQFCIFRGEGPLDDRLEATAVFSEDGKFRIVKKKHLPEQN
jgi:hypothetical protein